jgi:hypothetical protein
MRHYGVREVTGYLPSKAAARIAEATLVWAIELEISGQDTLITVEVHLDEDGIIQIIA